VKGLIRISAGGRLSFFCGSFFFLRTQKRMSKQQKYIVKISLIVALGGFLMGFDASVIIYKISNC